MKVLLEHRANVTNFVLFFTCVFYVLKIHMRLICWIALWISWPLYLYLDLFCISKYFFSIFLFQHFMYCMDHIQSLFTFTSGERTFCPDSQLPLVPVFEDSGLEIEMSQLARDFLTTPPTLHMWL